MLADGGTKRVETALNENFPRSHDHNIHHGDYQKFGKKFDQVAFRRKCIRRTDFSTNWLFDKNFRRSVVVDEVSFDEVSRFGSLVGWLVDS